MHVTHLFHGARQQNISYHRRDHDHQNPAPRVQMIHVRSGLSWKSGPSGPRKVSVGCRASAPVVVFPVIGSAKDEDLPCSCAVSAGPPATNPTPPEISAIPIHRVTLTCSCSAKRAISASKTYPS